MLTSAAADISAAAQGGGMSFIQRLITSIVPRSWAQAMEAESRSWLARCEGCGSERSIWELGGIRFKAAGSPRSRLACPGCARPTWHQIHRSASS
jgi:hypothetical protein